MVLRSENGIPAGRGKASVTDYGVQNRPIVHCRRPEVFPLDSVAYAASILTHARSVVALTGAGVSAESSIPTFRGQDGLWKQFRAEDLANPSAFARDPKLVWEWYDWRRQKIAPAQPNLAHHALAQLEQIADDCTLVTQNVDGLHQAAGSRNVLELHGNIWRVRCTAEGTVTEDRRVPLPEIPPCCSCGALLRPDIVWFGEALPRQVLQEAMEASRLAQVILVVGTSAVVQPAASLPLLCLQGGGSIIEVNAEPTPLSSQAAVSLIGKAGEILPQVLNAVG